MKYCAYCGTLMEDRGKHCPSCGERCKKPGRKRRVRIVVALILAFTVLLIAAAGLFLWEKPVRLASGREAARYMEELGKKAGLRNATEDLEVLSEVTTGGVSFYRLQQTYKDIPVYGRTAVCMTDEEGLLLGFTQDLRDMPRGLDLEPTVTAEQVSDAIAAFEGGIMFPYDLELTEDMLCIFDIDGDDHVFLAYRVDAMGMEYLVDAHDARVLHREQLISYASAEIGFEGGMTFTGWKSDTGNYVLMDYERSIYLLDSQYMEYCFPIDGRCDPTRVILVESPDPVFGDGNDTASDPGRAEGLLQRVKEIQDIFREKTGVPFDSTLLVCYDDEYFAYVGYCAMGGWNDLSSFWSGPPLPGYDEGRDGGKVGMISIGKGYVSELESSLAIVAHEYTHVLSRKAVGWTSLNGETGALNEGLSDIFGTLVEAELLGTYPEWKVGDRTIYDPSLGNYPVMADGAGQEGGRVRLYQADSPTGEDYTHLYSTVISHAAYRMWQGYPDRPGSDLDQDQLMRLWYRAMLLLPADADFTDCRQAVLLAADSMDLTDAQMRTIRMAFDDAGIPDPGEDYLLTVSEDFELSVRDADGARVQSYSIIAERQDGSGLFGLGTTWRKAYSVRNGKDLQMELEKGTYELTIINAADNSQFLTVDIKVAKKGEKELRLYTDFISGPPEEQPTGETMPVEIPSAEADATVQEQTAAYRIERLDNSLRDADGTVLVAYYCDYIVFEGDSKAIQKINEHQLTTAQNHVNSYPRETLEAFVSRGDPYGGSPFELTLTGSVVLRTEDMVFVRFLGGDTSVRENYGWAYSLSSGKKLTLAEVVSVSEKTLLPQLRDTVWTYVTGRHGDMLWDLSYDILYSLELEDYGYTVKDGQIWILFTAGHITRKEAGILEIPMDLYLE